MTYHILITDDIYASGLAQLQSEGDVQADTAYGLSASELRKRISSYEAVITRSGTALDDDFFSAAAGHLKVAARAGVGLENIDIEAATRAGVMVMNIPEVNAVAAAEMALALMLALCRNVPQSNALLRAEQWERLSFMGIHLEGKTLGLVGLGRVGRRVAARAHAFGMHVIAFDPYVPDDIADSLKVELVEQLDPLLERSDFVSLHCQLTDETRGMIGAAEIKRMKPGARLINAARGGLVDETALLEALQTGHMAGAALDVYQTEPPSGVSSALIQLPNVVATPHLGASTFEAQHDVSIRIVRQVLDALRGTGYHNVVNLPYSDGEDYRKLAPFMLLAEKIGSLQMQLTKDRNIPAGGMQVHVAYRGEELTEFAKPLAVALLKGLLTPILGKDVNYVNAPYLANEYGLSMHQMDSTGMQEYSNVVACQLVTAAEKRLIAGTLLTRSQPRIVRLDDIPMDVLPEGFMLAILSRDIPGVIAQVASTLGESKLNIAEYRLGRDKPGGTAFSFINLDSEAPEAVLVKLRGPPAGHRGETGMFINDDFDRPHEECGLIGIFAPNEDVARMTFFGLFALQHRGQEAAGIAVSNGSTMSMYKDIGLVAHIFTPQTLAPLVGHYAIGHTRYSTTGSSSMRNVQPFMIETMHGPLALAHNGNLVNSTELRDGLLREGVGLSSSSNSEVMTMMLARAQGGTWSERIQDCMKEWQGAYSLVILTRDCVYAIRDPWGFRPLNVGTLPSGGSAVASETGALQTLGCEVIREIKPGEIVTLSDKALVVHQALEPVNPQARCVFEFIYFARPDHVWDERSVHHVRQRLGEELAREVALEADVVIPVPDLSVPAAIGFSHTANIPYNDGFVKNRYVGRTFIEPTDSLRKRGVALKFNVINENVRDKRVIMVDDSIVRGNTTGPLVKLLRNAGAREVHVAITCPPITHPCFMGVDMGSFEDLIAHKRSVEEIRRFVGADSLAFLSLEGMMRAVGRTDGYCQACFTGQYPIPVDLMNVKTGFERGIA